MKKFFTVLLFLFSVVAVSAEDMIWAMNADSGEQIALSEVDYLIAADDAKEFSIVLNGGATIDGVKEVTFMMVSSVAKILVEETLQMFPNPVVSTFNLSGYKANSVIKVLSIDGSLLKSVVAESESLTIDVSDLVPGYYLLSTEHSTIKFIKK